MQFIDEARIFVKSGAGGGGCVSFRREKYIERGGPDGGDGGDGGSVVFVATSRYNTLMQFRFKRHFKATNGEPGKGQNKTGKSRKPLFIYVPIGTQIFAEGGQLFIHDFTEEGQQFELLKGGKGGLGNNHFKSSTNQAPRRSTPGDNGEQMEVELKLKLLSDVGLVGLPNAGKSTFLSKATSAKPKIADYAFTTIKPQLGVVYVRDEEFVLADIPGLIKNAHKGSGLGDKFLKHIERCGVLIHLIDASSDDVVADYNTIRHELESYSPLLQQKKEIICLNKVDLLPAEEINARIAEIEEKLGKKVHNVSAFHNIGMQDVLRQALDTIRQPDEYFAA